MNDAEVIDAFVEHGRSTVFGPTLNIEGGTLKLDGWWAMAYRVSERTLLVRDEQPPTESRAPADLAAALKASGLVAVGADLPAVTLLTYTNLDLGYAPWVVWSTDLATGEADLNAKATEETFLEDTPTIGREVEPDNTDQARGARRLAGAPSRVVLTVGLTVDRMTPLRDLLDDCHFERRAFGEIHPGDCGTLLPTLVLVDATGPRGSTFVAELHAARATNAPVVAVTLGGDMREGADATVDAADSTDSWVPLLRDLLR